MSDDPYPGRCPAVNAGFRRCVLPANHTGWHTLERESVVNVTNDFRIYAIRKPPWWRIDRWLVEWTLDFRWWLRRLTARRPPDSASRQDT